MKKFVAIFLIFILIFSFTLPSYATTVFDGLKEVNPTTDLSPGNASSTRGDILGDDGASGDSGNPSGWLQKIMDIVSKGAEYLLTPLYWLARKLPTIDGAIWAQQDTFQLSFFDASPTGFSGSLQGIIGSLYNALRYMVAAIYVIILVYLGVRMILSSIGKQKAHYKTLLQYWLTGLLLLFAFHWVMAFAIWVSDTLTAMFAETGKVQISSVADSFGTVDVIGGKASNLTDSYIALIDNCDKGSLWALFSFPVKLILLICLIAFGLFITITYIKRLFTVALLLVLFPLVVLSYVFDKIGDRRAQTFGMWLKEFMTNVFVQPIHALLLLIITFLLELDYIKNTPVAGAILAILLLGLLPVGEKQIKQLFQINSSMGAGAGGLAGAVHTLAHASQLGKSLKGTISNSASSLQERISKTKNKLEAGRINKIARKEVKKRGDRAKASAEKRGYDKAKVKMLTAAAKKAKWDEIKNSDDYKNKMKALGQKTGSFKNDVKAYGFKGALKGKVKKSFHDTWNEGKLGDKQIPAIGLMNLVGKPIKGAGKTIAFAGKHLSIPVGAGVGLANGMMSADDLVSLASGSAIGFATGSTAGLMARNSFSKMLVKTDNLPQELKDAEILLNTKFSALSDDEKQQLATAVGLGKNEIKMITEDNRSFIASRLEKRKNLAMRGLNYKGAYAEAFDDGADGVSKLQSGLDAYTGEPLKASDYTSQQTKDALYMKHKKTGQAFRLKGYGSKDASDSVQPWYNNDMNLEALSSARTKDAYDLVNKLNGDGVGAANSAFVTQKQYDDCLSKEILSAQKSAHAQISTITNLANSSYNIMDNVKPSFYATSNAQFHTVESARKAMSASGWTDVCSKYSSYADNLTGGTLSTNELTNKVIALEQAQLPISLETICQNAGCNYETFKQGNATEAQIHQIAQSVQAEYKSAPADIQQTVMANVIDMQNKTSTSIQEMVESGTLSKESINMAVAAATGNQYTNITESTKLKEFLTNTSIETQNNALHFLNSQQRTEFEVTPYAPTIVTAQKSGKITTPVNVSNVPLDASQVFGSCANTAVQMELFRDPTTGSSKLKVSSLESPSKSMILDTDLDTTSGVSKIYAGDLTLDGNGNLVLQRSDEEVAVFEAPQQTQAETFGDITLTDIQDWSGGTSSTKFTLIRNEDICVVLDESNNVILVKQGLESIGRLDQPRIFYVKASGNELQVSGPSTSNHDTIVRSRCKTYGRRIQQTKPEEYSLLNRLFSK